MREPVAFFSMGVRRLETFRGVYLECLFEC